MYDILKPIEYFFEITDMVNPVDIHDYFIGILSQIYTLKKDEDGVEYIDLVNDSQHCMILFPKGFANYRKCYTAVSFYPDLKIQCEVFVSDKYGRLVFRRPSSKNKIWYEHHFKRYMYGGKLIEKIHGVERSYFFNGQVRSESYWQNAEKEGYTTTYWSNGNLRWQNKWKRGRNTGILRQWHSNGKPDIEPIFNKKGKVIKEMGYRKDGKLRSIRNFNTGTYTCFRPCGCKWLMWNSKTGKEHRYKCACS